MILGALAGALGCASAPPPPKTTPPALAAAPAGRPPGRALVPDGPPVERIAVPLGGPARGPSTAKVTIVEFSDFQCPFCGRVNATLEQLLRDYPNDVRILFRHNPLPFHNNAAAGRRSGRGRREAGEVLGDARQAVRGSERPRAPGAGAARRPAGPRSDGVPRRARHATPARPASTRTWRSAASSACAGRRPSSSMDGRSWAPSLSPPSSRSSTTSCARADDLLRRGVPRDKLYATLLAGAKPTMANGAPTDRQRDRLPRPHPRRARARRRAAESHRRRVRRLSVSVLRAGPPHAPGAAEDLRARRGAGVSPQPAAVSRQRHAGRAGRRGGAPAGEVLGDARQALRARHRARSGVARQVRGGARARRARDSRPTSTRVRRARIASPATATTRAGSPPAGRRGSSSMAGRSAAPSQSRRSSRRSTRSFARRTRCWPPGRPAASSTRRSPRPASTRSTDPPPAKPDPDADLRIRVDVAGAPARGPADAPITIVEWSDFQCPFCVRAEETLTRLRQDYPGTAPVRLARPAAAVS